MRICHVAHGVAPIPPHGWGAIEASIADLSYWARREGHEFHIVNTRDRAAIVAKVNAIRPDVVHLHCEFHFDLIPQLEAKVSVIGSQWPQLYAPENEEQARRFLGGTAYVCCVSERIRQRCLAIGLDEARLFVLPNGARTDLIDFRATPRFEDRAICLAAVNRRKRQHLLREIPGVDFAGPIRPEPMPEFRRHPRYLGEWSRAKIYTNLTDYPTLVLLSAGEAAPLVTCEALAAGLGLVVSEAASANLDASLPFIDVIPEEAVGDPVVVAETLRKNQRVSRTMRAEIRRYALENFALELLARRYLQVMAEFVDQGGREPVFQLQS